MQPVEMEDPYADEPPKCILCKHKVDLDYKVCVTIFCTQFQAKLTVIVEDLVTL